MNNNFKVETMNNIEEKVWQYLSASGLNSRDEIYVALLEIPHVDMADAIILDGLETDRDAVLEELARLYDLAELDRLVRETSQSE